MAEGDTLLNALIGGVASVVLSFVPFSPVLGGAIAGYLQGGSRDDGLRVGGYAGVVAAVPLLFVVLGFLALSGVALLGVGPRAAGGIGLVLLVVGVALVAVGLYTVVLSALGGWIGNYVRYDTDLFD